MRTIDTVTLIHPPIIRTLLWHDEDACARFANLLSQQPALRDASVELRGPLGAGKTTFVRHLLTALGVTGRIKSPTYAVLEPYDIHGLQVSHFDFYRFRDAREWEDAGFRDIFGAPGLKLAEWPDNAAAMLPPPDLAIDIDPQADGSRQVRVLAGTTIGASVMAGITA